MVAVAIRWGCSRKKLSNDNGNNYYFAQAFFALLFFCVVVLSFLCRTLRYTCCCHYATLAEFIFASYNVFSIELLCRWMPFYYAV